MSYSCPQQGTFQYKHTGQLLEYQPLNELSLVVIFPPEGRPVQPRVFNIIQHGDADLKGENSE